MNNGGQQYRPYPQPQQPPKKKKPKWVIALIIVGIVLVMGVIGCSLEDSDPSPTDTDNTTKQEESIAQVTTTKATETKTTEAKVTETTSVSTDKEPEEQDDSYGINQTLDIKGLKMTLLEVRESEGEGLVSPGDGNVFVSFLFDVSNESGEDVVISSLLHFNIYIDDYTQNLGIYAIMDSGVESLDGTVAAGKKMKGVIAFECPENWEEAEVVYTPTLSKRTYTFKFSRLQND